MVTRSNYWTRAEIAAAYKCSKRHVDRMANAGKLTRIKFGVRAVRFKDEEVQALLSA